MASGKGVILGSLVLTGGLIGADELAAGNVPGVRTFVAFIVLFIILSILADFQPDIAKALAVLVALAVLIRRGPRVFGKVSKMSFVPTRGGGG